MQQADRILEKLDKIEERLSRIESDLATHMLRTDIAETNIDVVRQAVTPIQEHVAMVRGAAKLIGFLGGAAGLAAALWEAFGP